jgi:predicted nucleotidyltransferase component of viral defense system
MDRIASAPSSQRLELFRETAVRMGISPGLTEKDFWVCWTLKHLFSIPAFESRILFKGGTTLSKVFGVIRRFSEDIDLAVDYIALGFTGERNPMAEMSNTRRTKLLAEMLESCRRYIATEFINALRDRMAGVLSRDQEWELSVDAADGHVVNLRYPRAVETPTYLRPEVRLELGTHAEFIPNDRYVVRPYAADHFPFAFSDADCSVQAIKIERSFWEKATILHQEHFRQAEHGAPTRYSRHYYDVYMMAKRDDVRRTALSLPDLLRRVVEHKKRFYPRKWARYDLAVPATLALLPSSEWTAFLRRDYEDMQVMLFGEAPSFDEVLEGLRTLEHEVRRMPDTEQDRMPPMSGA